MHTFCQCGNSCNKACFHGNSNASFTFPRKFVWFKDSHTFCSGKSSRRMPFHSQTFDSGKLVLSALCHSSLILLIFSVSGLENKEHRSGPIFKCHFLVIGLLFQGCFSASPHLSDVPLSHPLSDRTQHISHKKLTAEALVMIIDMILLLSKIIKKNMSTLLKILQLHDFYMAMVI